ncbi:GDSL-type esterase/lipase family protein [Paenibacillus sp. CC-CFT747]|nr:GDSL-type esterase/lipase family protein [Paenibacillus sp. CC-CFT747]
MYSALITSEWIQGAVSLEKTVEGVRPWRLPYDKSRMFDEGLIGKAREAAGIRVAFTGTGIPGSIELEVVPDEMERLFDLIVDDRLIQTVKLEPGEDRCLFDLPAGERFEIYLPQNATVVLKSLHVDQALHIAAYRNERARWITYGSSITQCAAAASPSQTWPAIVARNMGWDLTCLGFGGQCQIEPMVARVIRELPADVFSLCLGINVMGGSSLNIRTFRSSVIGMIELIREKHTTTPLVVCSPIYCSYRESTENAVGMTLEKMREEIRAGISILQGYGDSNLMYIDGLELFGEAFAGYQPDQLHPNAEGYQLIGARMTDILTGLRFIESKPGE